MKDLNHPDCSSKIPIKSRLKKGEKVGAIQIISIDQDQYIQRSLYPKVASPDAVYKYIKILIQNQERKEFAGTHAKIIQAYHFVYPDLSLLADALDTTVIDFDVISSSVANPAVAGVDKRTGVIQGA